VNYQIKEIDFKLIALVELTNSDLLFLTTNELMKSNPRLYAELLNIQAELIKESNQ
jgi:hypothetical protein